MHVCGIVGLLLFGGLALIVFFITVSTVLCASHTAHRRYSAMNTTFTNSVIVFKIQNSIYIYVLTMQNNE